MWQTGPETGQAFWQAPGTTFTYASWNPGDPNNAGGIEDNMFMGVEGNWYDFAGTSAVAGYVVEVGGRPGDGAFTDEDTSKTIAAATLLANDTDVDDGHVLTITGVSGHSALGASVTLVNGNVVYNPTATPGIQALAAGEYAFDSFTYTVSDEHGASSSATVSLTVLGVNDAPVAQADTNAGEEDTLITGTVAASDSDVDHGAVLSYSLIAPVPGLTLNANGSYSFDAGNAAYQHLAQGATTDVVANYKVTDEHGAFATSTLTIHLTGRNDAPVAANDSLDRWQSLQASAYHYDPDNGHWYRVEQGALTGNLTYTQALNAAAGYGGYLATITSGQENAFVHNLIQGIQLNFSIGDPHANRGAWLGGSDSVVEGRWVWQTGPETGQAFWQAPGTTFTYASWNPGDPNNAGGVEDNMFMGVEGNWYDFAGTNAVAGYVVEVGGRPGDGAFTDEDTPKTIAASTLLANDTDVDDGHVLSITGVSATSALGASVTLVNGDVVYDPSTTAGIQALAAGTYAFDSFTYTVSDEHGASSTATVSLTVTGVNDAATITVTAGGDYEVLEAGGIANGMPGDPSASGDLDVSDVDTGEARFQIPSSLAGTYGDFLLNVVTGAWSYTLDQARADHLPQGQEVTDTLTMKSFDGTATHDIVVNITGANDTPVAANDSLDRWQSLQASAYHYDPDNGHWYRVEQGALTGNLTYTQALNAAAGYGGYLATITSGEENAFIHGLIQGIQLNGSISDQLANRGAWLGGSDAAVEGIWVWQTGPETGQAFWKAPGTTFIYASWNQPSRTTRVMKTMSSWAITATGTISPGLTPLRVMWSRSAGGRATAPSPTRTRRRRSPPQRCWPTTPTSTMAMS